MRKVYFFIIIISLILVKISSSQTVKILNEINDFPVPGVNVYNNDRTSVTVSNPDGIISIDKFSENDSIIFRHIAFREIIFTKKGLKKSGNQVFLVPNEMLLSEIRVVSSNARENVRELPYKLDKLYSVDILNSTSQNAADVLISSGNVAVQKSQGGGGSPILRGFEANKILLVVDGVRMNNAIYRSGHLQNSITIDNSVLEKINIIYGPSSIIYGSDALGGVIHYFTKKPKLAANNAYPVIKLCSYDKYSTASKSYVRHSDFMLGYKRISSLSSITYSKFGDIKIGKNRMFSKGNSDWGLNKYYYDNINGIYSTVLSENPDIQRNTAYKQYDFLQKIRFSPSKALDITSNTQYSTSSNINRYDKLTEFKDDNLSYAEWYYGPQKRFLTALDVFYKPAYNRLFTNVKAIFAYQNIEESRNSRKFGNDNLLKQKEKLNIYSLNLDFLKVIDLSRLCYGIEVSYNDVDSKSHYENIYENTNETAQTRYPDGGSTMTTAAAYANLKWLFNEKNILTIGARYSYINLNSNFKNTQGLVQLPFSNVNISKGAPTGSLSYIWFPAQKWQITITASTGFRSPNVDDYGKIRAKKELVTVPYDGLKPEYAYNTELGITRFFGENIRLNVTGFSTWLQNAIVRSYHTLNGNDSLFYDGDNYKIITKMNTGKAVVRGVSLILDGDWTLDSTVLGSRTSVKLRGTFNYIYGKDLAEDVPLGHIPPIYGLVSLKFNGSKLSFRTSFIYNFLKKANEMSPFGEDNEDKALAEGFPGWFTFNASVAYNFTRRIKFQIAVDNIADVHYRPFASGLSAPGRNFVFTFLLNI